jgi:N-acetylneuraminic acid mutarotase
MAHRRSYVAAAEVEGRIYVAGGMVGETGRRLAIFERFDPGANEWTTLAPLPEAVRAGAAAAVGRVVYVIGGTTERGGGRQVFAYDVRRAAWRRRAPLPAPRFNHAAVALGGKVYVLGGFSGTDERDDVFVYDPAVDRWSRERSLPRPVHAFGAAVFRRQIWVLGGRRGEAVLREVSIYDPVSGRWRRGPPMPKAMELLGAAVAGDDLHAVWESTYQIFDPGTRRWASGPRPRVPRHGLAVFSIRGSVYAIGGCTTELRDSQVVERRRVA